MRLIDADALFAEFENVGWYNNADRDEIAEPLILQSPTIDAISVVHGEWIISYIGNRKQTECSACGKSFTTYDVYGWNYCPWCGAKMRGANDERHDI